MYCVNRIKSHLSQALSNVEVYDLAVLLPSARELQLSFEKLRLLCMPSECMFVSVDVTEGCCVCVACGDCCVCSESVPECDICQVSVTCYCQPSVLLSQKMQIVVVDCVAC